MKNITEQASHHIHLTQPFPVVGIGASSGGLEAFTEVFNAIPNDTGMAFVLIQHLDPRHPSLLSQALSKATLMPVAEIKEGDEVKPNHVYVIPSSCDIGILRGKFSLFPRDLQSRKPNMAVDFFFHSLAAEFRNRAIGVVLTGTGTDGTDGLRAIKAENGFTLVQDPKTAKYSGMPQNAVTSEVADLCLSIPKIVEELIRLSKHPHTLGRLAQPFLDAKDVQDLKKVFVLLKREGIDLSEYKPATIRRRLARRMALMRFERLSDYIKVLQENPEEIKFLAADVLIHVTSFFRDPEVFERLKKIAFPEIMKNKAKGSPIRLWVAGCSSGEEVYSIVIALLEYLGEDFKNHPIQMFGSDISERMINKARTAVYSESSVLSLDPERVKNYFVKMDAGYRISNVVRGLCVFVRHDLARDPPFSKLDLVTCRNVLIYFEPVLQKRIISTFHYCLKQPGFLLLGKTESVSSNHRLFSTVDKSNKIFARSSTISQLRFSTLSTRIHNKPVVQINLPAQIIPAEDLSKQVDSLILSQYSPGGVIVNESMDVIQYRGKSSIYLEHPPGRPQTSLLKLLREGLFASVKIGLDQAKKKMVVIRKEGVSFKNNGVPTLCNVSITPLPYAPGNKEKLFLVLFEELPNPTRKAKGTKLSELAKKQKAAEEKHSEESAKLEHELRSTQEYLQNLNDEHQKANDTLNTVNEEFVSGNEELQSMNEELETAKEELQSTNEELTTVNDELQNRINDTAGMNDDLINLLHSAEIPILILDLSRKVRRFTPKAKAIMNLLPTDIGRQIDDIKPNIKMDDLDDQIKEVIDSGHTKESEVQDRQGKWHRIQIRPYRTVDNKIAGAVISLTNIDMLRRAVIDAEWVRDYSTSIVEAVQIPLLVLDVRMAVVSANQVFYDTFSETKEEIEGKNFYEITECQWNVDHIKEALNEILKKKNSFQNKEVSCNFTKSGTKVMSLSARPIQSHDGNSMILVAIEDITERKTRERDRKALLLQTQEAKADADKANLAKDLFLATLSHELRTPLTSLILQAQMLQRGTLDENKIKKASRAIERAAKTQAQLIGDLLDVSRIVTGKLKMDLIPVNLADVIQTALETVSPFAESKSVVIEANLENSVPEISGDPIRLQQVVWNLLTNAIKFTSSGKKVTINLKRENNRAEIQVIDFGIGISAEFLPHVFNRFSQAEGGLTRTQGGLGLGLAIVRHLVEAHDGTVTVASEGHGKGSTFTVSIPFIGTISEHTDSQSIKTPSLDPQNPVKTRGPALTGLKILVVEDDTDAREAISQMLDQSGVEVRAVSGADEALIVLEEFSPDSLVMDISMPGEDGYTLLRKIRNGNLVSKETPAVALTALASDKDKEDALTAGFKMHLIKPIDIDGLTTALMEVNGRDKVFH